MCRLRKWMESEEYNEDEWCDCPIQTAILFHLLMPNHILPCHILHIACAFLLYLTMKYAKYIIKLKGKVVSWVPKYSHNKVETNIYSIWKCGHWHSIAHKTTKLVFIEENITLRYSY